MTNNRTSPQWLAKWITASTLSWLFAGVFGALCSDLAWNNLFLNIGPSILITALAVFVFGGVVSSLAQRKILHATTDEASHWGMASIEGWAIGTLAGILIFVVTALLLGIAIAILMPGSDEGSSWARPLTFAIFALPVAAAVGWLGAISFVGVFQSKVLNQFAQRNSHWVRTTIISGILGLVVVVGAMISLRTQATPVVVFGILGGTYGTIVGAITGTRMASLLSLESKKEEVAEM